MKFICSECTDDDNEKPCELKVPKTTRMNEREFLLGLNTCPFESLTFVRGKKWKLNGEHVKAEWERVK